MPCVISLAPRSILRRTVSLDTRERNPRGVSAKISCSVSLHWRTLEKPAAKATCAMGSAGRLEQDACRLSPLGPGDRQRSGAHLGRDDTVQLANAVAQAAGESLHPLTVDRSISDESHGAGDHVGPHIPLRRAGGGVGPAAQAGSKSGLLCRGGGGVEAHVLPLGCAGGAAGAAVDAGRGDADEEDAVEAGIFTLRRLIAAFRILDHPCMLLTPWQRSPSGNRT